MIWQCSVKSSVGRDLGGLEFADEDDVFCCCCCCCCTEASDRSRVAMLGYAD